MSVFSKMYGYPTGYLVLIYRHLLSTNQIKTEQDVIDLVRNFGYPEEIINEIAQEMVCSDGVNIYDIVEDWSGQLHLDKKAEEEVEVEMGYVSEQQQQESQSQEIEEITESSQTDNLNSDE